MNYFFCICLFYPVILSLLSSTGEETKRPDNSYFSNRFGKEQDGGLLLYNENGQLNYSINKSENTDKSIHPPYPSISDL